MNALRRGSGAARAVSRGSGATTATAMAAVLGRSRVVRLSSTSSAAGGAQKEETVRWPLSITREVNWGELDSFNHVNNVVHFRWFETLRCEQALKLGIDLSPTAGASLILAESNCRYLRPVMWPDTVTISTRTTAIGETSWTTEFQVESKEQEAVCAVGYSRLVYYDYKEGKKTPIPQELRDRINRLEGTNF